MKKKNYIIKLKILTGLHIGIGSDRPEIGGIDNPFIKDPISKLPYIPGSSLKGKLRSLLETETDKFKITDKKENGKTKEIINDEILKVYGGGNEPTRLIFRDLTLSVNGGEKGDINFKEKFLKGEIQTEAKTEVAINRKTGKAAGSGPRTTERIPPETEFEGEILIRYSDENDLKNTISILDKAVELLNNDYLGGSGSRGYGAVKVTLIEKESKENVEA